MIPFEKLSLVSVLASVVKGILLYYSIKYIADLAGESNSSSVFAGYISLGVGAILNNFILNDSLNFIQMFSCIGLSILGTVFFFRGPASDLSKFGKKVFMLLTLVIIVIMFVDKVAISGLNWYMHLLINSTVFFIVSMVFLVRDKTFHYLTDLKSQVLVSIGLVFAVGEFIILYSMQNYMPVSIALLFIRLGAPIVMFVSAYIYKERTPREQLLFGSLALLFALPILFK